MEDKSSSLLVPISPLPVNMQKMSTKAANIREHEANIMYNHEENIELRVPASKIVSDSCPPSRAGATINWRISMFEMVASSGEEAAVIEPTMYSLQSVGLRLRAP